MEDLNISSGRSLACTQHIHNICYIWNHTHMDDLPILIFSPETTSNQNSTSWRNRIWPRLASHKTRVSSAKRRWVTCKEFPVGPTLILDMSPSLTALSNILLKAFITITNYKGDNGSPYLIPLELSKKPRGVPLMRMENLTVEMQKKIHLLHNCNKTLLVCISLFCQN